MKAIINILFLTLGSVSFAENVQLVSGEAPYDTIIRWNQLSQSTSIVKSEGVYEGRCFSFRDKNIPTNKIQYAVLTKRPVSLDSGPAFPSIIEGKVGMFYYSKPLTKAHLLSLVHNDWNFFVPTLQSDSPLVYEDKSVYTEVRSFNTYLIAAFKTKIDLPCRDNQDHPACQNSSVVPAGSDIQACYFYNELE